MNLLLEQKWGNLRKTCKGKLILEIAREILRTVGEGRICNSNRRSSAK